MWQTISSQEIFNHPRLTLIEDEVILSNGIKTKYLKYKDNGGCWTTIIAKRTDKKILIQYEYTYPINQKLFRMPGGAILPNEKTEDGVNRELMEETGFKANNLELLGSYLMNGRRSTAKAYVYLATDLIESKLKSDEEEEIEIFWFSENEIIKMIKDGKIINVHALAAWCLYKINKQKK